MSPHWSFGLTTHDVGRLVLSHHISCEALPGGGRTWGLPGSPLPTCRSGGWQCWGAGRSPRSSWLAGRVLRVPVRTGQPHASRDLHFCDRELPTLAKVMVRMTLTTSKCDFYFLLRTSGNFLPSYACIGALINWRRAHIIFYLFLWNAYVYKKVPIHSL